MVNSPEDPLLFRNIADYLRTARQGLSSKKAEADRTVIAASSMVNPPTYADITGVDGQVKSFRIGVTSTEVFASIADAIRGYLAIPRIKDKISIDPDTYLYTVYNNVADILKILGKHLDDLPHKPSYGPIVLAGINSKKCAQALPRFTALFLETSGAKATGKEGEDVVSLEEKITRTAVLKLLGYSLNHWQQITGPPSLQEVYDHKRFSLSMVYAAYQCPNDPRILVARQDFSNPSYKFKPPLPQTYESLFVAERLAWLKDDLYSSVENY